MTLNLCPPEVCSQIFAIACTDGGYTGRALSAVSRYIHRTSSSYKFQSIALHNAHQTSSFASVLSRTPPHLCGVVYLFVSNDDFAIVSRDREPTATSGRRRISSIFSFATNQTKLSSTSANLIKDHDTDFIEAVLAILRIIAPTLRTLFISFECHWINWPSLVSVGTRFLALSSLTELSFNYRAPTDALFNHYMHLFPATLPSLRRLDISGLKLLSYHSHLFGSIAKIAPSLTHLHLPAKMAMNVPCASTIWPPVYHTPEDENLPLTLNRVLIQLNGPHIYACQSPESGCTRCRLLAVGTTDRRFVALEARSDDTWKKNRERLEGEWRNRISGGEGGWDETTAVDDWINRRDIIFHLGDLVS